MTNTPATGEELIAVALDILVKAAGESGTAPKRREWAARLSEIANYLAAEDRLKSEVQVPRSERLREWKRVIERLERIGAGAKPRTNPITLTERTLDDVRQVWPGFTVESLQVTTSDEAASVAARLRRALSRLAPPPPDEVDLVLHANGVSRPPVGSHWFYGGAKARRHGDNAMHDAAADLLDLLNKAKGCGAATVQPRSPDGPWHAMLCAIAEAAGRPTKDAVEDRRSALEAVRRALEGDWEQASDGDC